MTERSIYDYAPYYLGCQAEYMEDDDNKLQVTLITPTMLIEQAYWLKPILRPLSSMTVDELCEIFSEKFAPSYAKNIIKAISSSLWQFHDFLAKYGSFDIIPKLCRREFDLFNLINDDLAIDKTKR